MEYTGAAWRNYCLSHHPWTSTGARDVWAKDGKWGIIRKKTDADALNGIEEDGAVELFTPSASARLRGNPWKSAGRLDIVRWGDRKQPIIGRN